MMPCLDTMLAVVSHKSSAASHPCEGERWAVKQLWPLLPTCSRHSRQPAPPFNKSRSPFPFPDFWKQVTTGVIVRR